MRCIYILILCAGMWTYSEIQQRAMAPHTIMCFCKPAPHLYADKPENIQLPQTDQDLQNAILKSQIDRFTKRGIIATYHGYVTFSDQNGQLLFPRKHTSDDIFYVVTRNIRPVISHGETVRSFIIENPKQTRMYYLQRKQNEKQNITYWEVKEIEVTDEQHIPPSSMIIFSNPDHIIVPTGTFTTIDGGNLLLPDLYIKKGIPIGPNVLAFLPLSKYFAPVTHTYAYTSDRYATSTRP